MIVKRLTDMADILKLVPIEVRLREKEKTEVPTKDMLTLIQSQLPNPLFGIWGVFNGNEQVLGYVSAYVNVIGTTKDMYIWRIWHDPKHKEVMNILQNILKEFAMATRTKKVKIEVTRGMKAFNKKWGFKPKSIIMEREV